MPRGLRAAAFKLDALHAARRLRPRLEKWLAGVSADDGRGDALPPRKGDDDIADWENPTRALVAGFFARAARFAPDATYRAIKADREITLHPLSVHADFGTPPDYVCFCDYALDDDGKTVARHVSRVDPKWLLEAGAAYYHLH